MAEVITVKVVRKTWEARDICALRLEGVDGHPLPGFSAGAHVDLHLPGGLVRQYSLLNDPADTRFYDIAVLREPQSRGGSIAVHDGVKEGQVLSISAPRNHFPLAADAPRSLLLAGGIGVTPLLAMAQSLHAAGAAFELHYCARSRDRAAFVDRLAGAPFGASVVLHFDDGPAEQVLDMRGTIGRQAPGTHLYVCGPAGFIEAAIATASAEGWAPERVHSEYFKAGALDAGEEAAFEVEVASTGEVFPVPPHVSALDVLIEAGFDIPFSCEEGVCGSCLTGVVAGDIWHRDHFLTPREHAANTVFTPCCSRARRGRLVLDL